MSLFIFIIGTLLFITWVAFLWNSSSPIDALIKVVLFAWILFGMYVLIEQWRPGTFDAIPAQQGQSSNVNQPKG